MHFIVEGENLLRIRFNPRREREQRYRNWGKEQKKSISDFLLKLNAQPGLKLI